MTTAPWELHDFEIHDVEVEQLGNDVAVIGYKVREKLTVDGKTRRRLDLGAQERRPGLRDAYRIPDRRSLRPRPQAALARTMWSMAASQRRRR
jgi:hypothetical protein